MDLVLIAGALLAQLGMQTYHFSIGSNLLGFEYSPRALLRLSQETSNGHGIEPIGLGPQALLLMKVVRLPGVQQAELVAPLLQFMVKILVVACGGLHPDHDLFGTRL
jgi:hypothetical protein